MLRFVLGAASHQRSTAASELNRIFRAENVPHRFKTAYIRELADNKRDFGCDVLDIEASDPGADVGESDFCAFKDLCDLHKLHVPCYRHTTKRKRSRNSDGRDGMCTVPRAEGIVGGISCKATCAPSHKRKISNPLDPTKPPEKGGSTWSTFYGLLRLLDALGQDRPDWLVIENADELVTSRDEEVIDVLLAELASRGFECFFMLMNSYDWAVAQSRRRVFVVGVSCIQPKAFTFDGEFDLEEMFEDLKNLIASARMQADCLTRALLPNDHPLVEAALVQWVERDVKGWDSNTLKTHMNF